MGRWLEKLWKHCGSVTKKCTVLQHEDWRRSVGNGKSYGVTTIFLYTNEKIGVLSGEVEEVRLYK